MGRFIRGLLLGVAAFAVCSMGVRYAFSQVYYTNSICSQFQTCAQDGVCQQIGGKCTNDGGVMVGYTQMKVTSFMSGTCGPLFSTDCVVAPPQSVCVTAYYFNSPDCTDNEDSPCPSTSQVGSKCKTFTP
jgi:hypothetical protein